MTETNAKPTPDSAKSLNNINWELKRLTESSNKRLVVEESLLSVHQGVLKALQSIISNKSVESHSNYQDSIKTKGNGLSAPVSHFDQSEIPF